MKDLVSVSLIVLLFMASTSACTTRKPVAVVVATPEPAIVAPPPAGRPATPPLMKDRLTPWIAPAFREVKLPLAPDTRPEPRRRETLAQAGLVLYEQQDHVRAASYFLQAADGAGADSRDNDFRLRALAAAAAAYLETEREHERELGDLTGRLRQELERTQLLTVDPAIALILAIAEARLRRPTAVPRHAPWPIRALFRDPPTDGGAR